MGLRLGAGTEAGVKGRKAALAGSLLNPHVIFPYLVVPQKPGEAR
jgi:hypothetical protein